MRFVTAIILTVFGFFSGCAPASGPSVDATTPNILVQSLAGYTFEFERVGEGESKVEGHRHDDDMGDVDETISLVCGRESATIANGRLTHGERDCGTVKVGDTIKLTSHGKLYVNGVER